MPLTKNSTNTTLGKQENGLTYNNEVISTLVNKDTDLDGVLDWEESLWGTDPTKKETTPGILDSVAIEKLKIAENPNIKTNVNNQDTENLTETDKFSREFFSTVATLNQNGAMDEATAEKISSSLAERIQNSTPRKVYVLSDIKTTTKDDVESIKNYNNTLDSIHEKYPITTSVTDILQKFVIDENNTDNSALLELDPIIKQTQGIINGTAKMSVPASLVILHLNFINALQRMVENLNDIKLYEEDVIISLSGISQYEKNITLLETSVTELKNAIDKKNSYLK